MRLYGRNGCLVCEPYEFAKQNSSSLFIQNADSDNIAKIIDKGDDSFYGYSIACEVNDIILYDKDKAKECILNNKKYIIVDMCDVLAIIKEDE